MGLSVPITGSLMGPGSGGGASFSSVMADYVAAGSLLRWYRFNETSGTTLVNHGAGGTALNGTVTGAANQQTGALGANEAYLFDGLTNYVSCGGGVSNNLATFTHFWLVKTLSLNRYGRWWSLGTSNSCIYNTNAVSYRLQFVRNMSVTDITAVMSTGDLALNTWMAVFITHDSAGDKKPRLYVATASDNLTLLVTGSASSGTPTDLSAVAYLIGARGVPDNFAHVAIDEHGLLNTVLSTDAMNALLAHIF